MRGTARLSAACGLALSLGIWGCGPKVSEEDLGEVYRDKLPEVPGANKTFVMPELEEKTQSDPPAGPLPEAKPELPRA